MAAGQINLRANDGKVLSLIAPDGMSADDTVTMPSSGTVATTEFVNSEISNDVGVANSELVKTALNATGDAPIYACRAWVNFNGTGTVAIRASGNVSSITDNGVGDYTVNFTTAMSDANYSVSATGSKIAANSGNVAIAAVQETNPPTITNVRVLLSTTSTTLLDPLFCSVAIFR